MTLEYGSGKSRQSNMATTISTKTKECGLCCNLITDRKIFTRSFSFPSCIKKYKRSMLQCFNAAILVMCCTRPAGKTAFLIGRNLQIIFRRTTIKILSVYPRDTIISALSRGFPDDVIGLTLKICFYIIKGISTKIICNTI